MQEKTTCMEKIVEMPESRRKPEPTPDVAGEDDSETPEKGFIDFKCFSYA